MDKPLAKKESRQGANLSETVDRWLSDILGGRTAALFPMVRFDWEPRVDIKDTDKEILISASLPGVEKGDINVQVSDHTLSIQGERREESEQKEKGGYMRREQSYGTFYRSFQLPDNVATDRIKASDKNGVLEVRIPKKEALPQPKGTKVDIE